MVATLLGQAGPAAALPPGALTQAQGIVGTGPSVVCPPSPQQVLGANPSASGVSATNVTVVCDSTSAVVTASSATGPGPAAFSNFQATCLVNGGLASATGSVTTTATGDPLGPRTVVDPVSFVVGGFTYSLNEESFAGGVVTRTAIHVTGPGTNVFLGQVQCASLYPLAVDAAAPAPASPSLATDSTISGGSSKTTLLLAGGIGALILAQVGFGLWARRRRTGLADG